MSLSFRCGRCKQVCVVGNDMVGESVRCPNGHTLIVPAGLTPTATSPLRPKATPARPTGQAAGAGKDHRAPQPRKVGPGGSTQADSDATLRGRARRAEPEGDAPENGRSPALVAVVVLGLLVVLLGGLGLGAWALFPGDSAKPAAQTELAGTGIGSEQQFPLVAPGGGQSNVELVAPPKTTSEVGATFTVQVLVRNPTAGLTVSVELPEGVELAAGSARQEVPPENAVTWSLRGTSVGNRTLTVRASNGSERRMEVDIRPKDVGDVRVGRTFDRLDRTKFDIQLPTLVADIPTPATWEGHTNHIRCVSFTSDGEFVISVSGDISRATLRPADNSIRVWDARQGKQVHKVEKFAEALDSLSISPGGRFALCSFGGFWQNGTFIRTKDHGVFMWDIQAKKAIGPGVDLAADPTGGRLEKPQPRFTGLGDMVFATDTSPDNETVMAGDGHGGMMLWDAKTGVMRTKFEVTPIPGKTRGVPAAKFSPDGNI